jgi:hypothetical protein
MSKTTNKITNPIHDIKDHRWFTHQIENGIQWKTMYSPYLLKIQQKNNKIYVQWKCNQNNKSNLWYSTLEYVVPLQSTYISTPKVHLYEFVVVRHVQFQLYGPSKKVLICLKRR